METDFKEQENAFRYLLGELSEDEQAAVEERFFADDEFSRFLDEAETDLIDDYVRGELPRVRKQNFERNFLVSERRRERVRAAQILQTELFGKNGRETGAAKISWWEKIESLFRLPNLAWAGGLIAIALFVLLGGIWLARQTKDEEKAQVNNRNTNAQPQPSTEIKPSPEPTNQSPDVNSNTQEPQNLEKKPGNKTVGTPEPQNSRTPPPAQAEQAFVAFTLLPPMRSSEKPVFIIPRDSQTIHFRVVHENAQEFVKYRAEIRSADGDLIWSREIPVSPKTLQKPIALNVRSGALASGSYELTLSGITADNQFEEINYYNFTVLKK